MDILTIDEYSKKFTFKGKPVSLKTVIRRCEDKLLPSNHYARKLPCKSGASGQWIVVIMDEPTKPVKIKPVEVVEKKPETNTINRKYFNLR